MSGTGLRGQTAISDGSHQFMNDWRAITRHVHSPVGSAHVVGFSAVSGGSSGDPSSPFYASQLGFWLTSDYYELPVTAAEVSARTTRLETFAPAP